MIKKVMKEQSGRQNAEQKHDKVVKLAKRLVMIETKMINSPYGLTAADIEEYGAKFLEFGRSDAGTPCPGCFLNRHNIPVPGGYRHASETVQ